MRETVREGSTVTGASGRAYRLEGRLKAGGQGAVFAIDGQPLVAKFYHPHLVSGEKALIQRDRLMRMIQAGSPSPQFVWPKELVEQPGLGYIMDRLPDSYISLRALNWDAGRADLKVRLTSCFLLADSFAHLHQRSGFAFCDASSDNVHCDPITARIGIIDNDNLTVDGTSSPLNVVGTPRYIAPELETGASSHPSIETDLYSLAVLIFETLLLHHPLLGDQVLLGPPDLEADALGPKARYIYASDDPSNRYTRYDRFGGVPATKLPESLQLVFEDSFTRGLRNPLSRVRETRWRRALINERDALVRCPDSRCPFRYTFFSGPGRPITCIWCGSSIRAVTVLRFLDPATGRGLRYKVADEDEWLAAHHCKANGEFDFRRAGACGHIERDDRYGLALRNVSGEVFVYYRSGQADPVTFPPNSRLALQPGYRIQFGANGLMAEVLT